MRRYTTPFGYEYAMGTPVINPQESKVVKKIFELASEGYSLSNIADLITNRYPDIVFNKNKVSRILKDERYKGNEVLERIIEDDLFIKANAIKSSMYTKRGNEEKAEVLYISVPFTCPHCHSSMRRIHENKTKCPERWKCSCCDCSIRYADVDLIAELKTIMTNLQNYKIDFEEDIVRKSLDTARLESDIKYNLENEMIDADQMRDKILRLASMKYSDIANVETQKKEISDSIMYDNIVDDYIKFLNQHALSVEINEDRTVVLTLKDGSKHRRTSNYGSSSIRNREESDSNSTNENFG